MYNRNRNEQTGRLELTSLPQAEEVIATLSQDIKNIEEQLKTRQPNAGAYDSYKIWKRKAQIAMALKAKKLQFVKNWITQHGGSKNIPSDDETMNLDYNMPAANNRYADITRRPQPDKIIDNVCGAVIQLRGLKWRLYPYLKIANLAFDIIESGEGGDYAEDMKYWLHRAGFDIEAPIRQHASDQDYLDDEEDMEDEELTQESDALEDDMEEDFEEEIVGMPKKLPKF